VQVVAQRQPGRNHWQVGASLGQCGLQAAIEALRALNRSCAVEFHTDSNYLREGITQWLRGWKRNGWRTQARQPVKNEDLWRQLDVEVARHEINWHWVKGHAGNEGNELVDELARTYAGDCRSHVREGYLPLEGWQSLLASEYSRGTDVPEDARMLMDGAISAAEYHMGRGQGDSATTGTGDSSADTANSSNSTKPRSIAITASEAASTSGIA